MGTMPMAMPMEVTHIAMAIGVAIGNHLQQQSLIAAVTYSSNTPSSSYLQQQLLITTVTYSNKLLTAALPAVVSNYLKKQLIIVAITL